VIGGLVPYAESQGFEIVLNESYASDTADFGPLINKMEAAGATVLFGGGHYPDGTTFAKQIYEQNVDLDWISLLVAPADSKWPELGDAALGIATSSQWELSATHTEAEANGLGLEWFGPSGADFAADYEAMTGDKPTYHVAGGYAAGLVLQKAIEMADSVDSDAVNAALESMNIMTFFGGTQFDTSAEAHGLQINHDQIIAQWQLVDGEFKRLVVWPADVAQAAPLFPYK
jgi:branched-chain amino acid transport system substrate-binding protein